MALPRFLVVPVAMALLLSCTKDDEPTTPDEPGLGGTTATTATTAATNPALELLALHAEGGDEPRFVDDDGRQVLLRGVNVNALGEYYQADADLPSTIALTDSDWKEMASLGFDSVRLIVSWSRLEPEQGTLDEDYLAEIHEVVDQAGANGIYVILDMHQDAWGPHIATPADHECPEGLEPAIGWDGAPEWATLTDDAETCRQPGQRESALAVRTAFQSFYDDHAPEGSDVGIRTALAHTWGRLAGEFADDPTVAGYDLFNEPNGVENLADELPKYTEFLTDSIAAIRAAETDAGGFAHIVFVEPIVLYPLPDTIPAPGFTDDDNVALAPHNYWESITDVLTIEQGFEIARNASTERGVPYWVGEYGWWDTGEENLAEMRRYAVAEDAARAGSAWWQWRQACGDPHSIGLPGGVPDDEIFHLHTLRCPDDEDLGITPEYAVVLSRTYPRAAPGRLTELVSEPDARTARITGTLDGAAGGPLVVWVPDGGHGEPEITGHGLTEVEVAGVDGGWLVTAQVGCDYVLEVDGADDATTDC